MFFITYLRRELSRRMRQTIFIALGLAVGVGLVVTVDAASAGVARAESTVLSTLDGVGTDVTVTGPVLPSPGPGSGRIRGGGGPDAKIEPGPGGWELCNSSGTSCKNVDGQTISGVNPPYLGISASKVAKVASLRGVAAAAGGITFLDELTTFPEGAGGIPQPGGYTIDGVDTRRTSLGPLGSASLTAGHSFTVAESDSDVAVLDSGYATSHGLKVGSAVAVGQVRYTVIGIVSQPQGTNPPSVYIPLARAQATPTQVLGRSLGDEVNMIYVATASAAGIPAVQKEISGLLPGTIVTTASNLASQVTGSVSSAAKLASDLGRWLSVLVLIAAFAIATLLTTAAVSRRAGEFGILRALGWRSRRIAAQVLGESAVMGIAGAAAGIGLGFAGTAIIAAVAPTLYATVGADTLPAGIPIGGPHGMVGGPALIHAVAVPLNPSVSVGVIALAVALAMLGGLLAGAFGSWRTARLRPADALTRIT